jgi:hypothetical protein
VIHQEFHVGPKVATLQVALGNYLSNSKEIKNEVVQGMVLSVTLFLIAMADIIKGTKETCTILGYADDWVIVTNSKAPIRAETRLKKGANSTALHEHNKETKKNSRGEQTITV